MTVNISPILWQNEERTVTLIDVPRSISAAQGTVESPSNSLLLSTEALLSPFHSHEPKSDEARAKLQSNTVPEDLHLLYEELLESALTQVRKSHQGHWCYARPFVLDRSARTAKKRKLDDPTPEATDSEAREELPSSILHNISHQSTPNTVLYGISTTPAANREQQLQPNPTDIPTTQLLDLNLVHNSTPHPQTLTITPLSTFQPLKFHVPPKSVFSLSSCTESQPFHELKAKFNLIILDPPWPNKSVRRARHGKCMDRNAGTGYNTSPTIKSMRDLLTSLNLPDLMALTSTSTSPHALPERAPHATPDRTSPGGSSSPCIIGIWLTNSPSLRALLLDPQTGLFAPQHWDLELLEEWLWLKTTQTGEPVTALDGAWRKPYEVFLLAGRRERQNSSSSATTSGGPERKETTRTACRPGEDAATNISSGPNQSPFPSSAIKRRVFISVPDLHSRKPNLLPLLQQSPHLAHLAQQKEVDAGSAGGSGGGSVLEIFARNLVAGWSSWGDECLKFNWEGNWKEMEDVGVEGEARNGGREGGQDVRVGGEVE